MISYAHLSLVVLCFAYSAAVEEVQEGSTPPPAPEDVAHRELTDAGYVIRYGDALYKYPLRIVPFVRPAERKPTETNEIVNEEEDKRRPLFYFTTYETPDDSTQRGLPTSRPYIEIRKKRNVENADANIPESSKIGKLRRKRTYCNKCGGGGYGTAYIPVTYVIYPVSYGGYGGYGGHKGHGGYGRGKGCYTCGGYGGGGYGGGGSYSYSSSSAQSSSGSFGYGKK